MDPTVSPSHFSLREAQVALTRRLILDAAHERFSAQGFAGARVQDIAIAAGISAPTIYKTFTNKRNLLKSVVDRAIAGSDDNMDVLRQAWWAKQMQETDPAKNVRVIAYNARNINARSATVLDVMRSAALSDSALAETAERTARDRRRRARSVAMHLVKIAGSRARLGVEATTVSIWTLTGPEVFGAQLQGGRREDQYEAWLADVLLATLLR